MSDRLRLILLSFLMLFVELALIRWTGSNVLYLSYFSNFVLLGSFLGIGLGFLRAHKPRDLFPYAPLALAALVAFIRFFPVDVRTGGSQLIFFSALEPHGPPRELVLPVIFLAVASAMMFIAEGVGRTFARFEPLEAYRLDLIGSLLGIAGFTALSFLRTPPVFWGVAAAATLFVLLRPHTGWLQVVPLMAVVGLLLWESLTPGLSWSPYYKVEVGREEATGIPSIDVNGVPHQAHARSTENPTYTAVYDQIPDIPLDDVLIIGAGGGNDVSVALARGAEHVDAVEIDPRLYDLGRARHPDRPYSDPRVDAFIDDGRAYVERTSKRYDLILLALPDSITLVSGQASLRLESYLFTKEAVAAYRDLLKSGGAFAMYNYYRFDWLADRFAGTLDEVFGRPPCRTGAVNPGGFRLDVFIGSADANAVACSTGEVWERPAGAVEPATDDHPFPYLRERTLPAFYLVTLALILLASLAMVRGMAGPLRPMATYADLFFMGAAFLLLETKNVVQFALLFGTTWFVNALVFAGVLLSVLAAVVVSRRVTFRRPAALYGVLLAALVVAWLVPLDALLDLGLVPRFTAAVTLAFFPIFTANLVFTQRFKDTGDSTTAFGANLLGAMLGGVIEYAALLVGYRMLLAAVAALYGLAFVFGRSHLRAGIAATAR